jgi:hypothetical protein
VRRAELARFLLVLGGSFLVTLWFFRVYSRHFSTDLPGANLDALHHLRVYRWQWDALASGNLAGIVDVPTMLPFPHGLAFGDNMLALSLTGWPLALLGREILAANFVVLASYALCATFCAGFVRALTGSAGAGLVAGAAWAFQPNRMGIVQEPNNLSIMWCALAAWAWVRWLDGRAWRWVAIGGVALYLQFLSSIQMTAHISLALGLWALGSWASSGFTFSRRAAAQAVTVLAAEVLLLAPWARVYAEVRAHAGTEDRLGTMIRHSAELRSYFGDLSPGTVVWALLALAVVLAVCRRAPRRRVAALASIGLLLVVFSLGPFWQRGEDWVPLPYWVLTKLGPVYANVRAPLRMQAIATLFLTGAAAFAVPWLAGLAATAWPSRERAARFSVTAAVLFLVLATVRPVRSGRTEVPAAAEAEPMRAVAENATFFLIPFHGGQNHVIPDYLQTFHHRGMIGGYQSSVPPLFFHLRNATDIFPEPQALAAIAATGATHVLLCEDRMTKGQLRAVDAATAAGRLTLVHRAAPWRIFEVPAAGLRTYDPSSPDARARLVGPSAAAPGQRVTIGLLPLADGTFCDLFPERDTRVIVTAPGGEIESVQEAVCLSRGLVEPDGIPYAITFEAPHERGEWLVRVEWDGGARTGEELPLAVREGLATTFDHPVGPFELRELGRAAEVSHQSQWPLTVRIRNDGDSVWLARSDCEIPPNRGTVVWTLRYTELGPGGGDPRTSEFLLAPDNHHHVLPHDVAPGDEVVCRVSMRAPRQPGEYAMEIGMGALHVTQPAEWTRVELAPLAAH